MSPRFRQDSLKFSVCARPWLARSGWLLSLVGIGQTTCQATPPHFAPSVGNAYYAQSDFTLPFQVKPGGRCPQSLDLMVSRDGGRNWQVHQTAAPAERCFQFAHAEEGEYWLKVQVRDAVGSALSQSTMHLFIDRTRPKSTMQCDWQGESQLLLNIKVEDAHLDTQSVQLEMRTDVDNYPRLVPLQQSNPSASGVEFQASIEMPSCKSFELRLVAKDRAGNKLVVGERYRHPVLADENDELLPATIHAQSEPVEQQKPVEVANTEWTTIELGTPRPTIATQLASVDASQSVVRSRPKRSSTPPEVLIPPERTEELSLDPPMPASHVDTRVNSPTRQFQIQYQLNEVVPPDQLNVELWVTTDCGASWEFWGIDRDSRSPAAIEVDRQGEYGFCVVCVHSEADLQYRPKAGDKPDLTVTVKEPLIKRRLQAAARD